MIKIAITDDHPLVLEGIKNILSEEKNFSVIATFQNGNDTRSGISENQEADILLLDINLPDYNSIDLIGKIKTINPDIKIIMLSVHNEFAVINSVLSEGASGYIQKNAAAAEILDGIHQVYDGKRFLCSQTQNVMKRSTSEDLQKVPKVTRREKEILQLGAKGFTTAEMGEKLFISPHTVESHRKNLIEKFGVKNLATAIKLAVEYGIISG